MSECVVRMEMPAQCASCPMWRMDFFKGKMLDLCRVNGKYMDTPYGERPDWCPIVCSLPEGHGRLVDADKEIDFHVNDFERVKTEGVDVYSKAYSLSDLCDGVTYAYDHANIIVPAEAERSET